MFESVPKVSFVLGNTSEVLQRQSCGRALAFKTMGKTRAEIQRAYRERKKAKEADEYKKKEVARVMKYYTPASLATKDALEKRRADGREKMRRQKAKRSTAKLKIKMDFKKKPGPRSKIKRMQYKLEKALQAKRKLEKRLERLTRKQSQSTSARSTCALTPRSKTNAEIRQAGLTPRRVPHSIRKKILFSNVFVSGLRESYKKKKTDGKLVIRRVVAAAGKVMKKYRMMNTLSKEIGIARNARMNAQKKTRRARARSRLQRQVLDFLERDDNSRSTSPDNFLRTFPDPEKVASVVSNLPQDGKIKYEEWKRVEVDGKKKIKIVTSEVDTTTFCDKFKEEVPMFRQHVAHANEQYSQLKRLKENLDQHNIVIQMDFAENYKVKSNDEIQSAYWNCDMVTLHPTVVYFKSEDGELQHESICIVFDEMGHNSATVFAILQRVVPEVRHPDVKYIHYWTDSPSSQYRNKTMFSVISEHEALFGIPACWNYFEAGHGKGPCDGIGGTAKRMADQAVTIQGTTIQDAHEFYMWASQLEKSAISYCKSL
ncbi:hypothetical protein Bbelb_083830 [Branchiostoma belcheri]|nr:hypothetical protein Bbelb_083830 [Branchiostoma belcheri]